MHLFKIVMYCKLYVYILIITVAAYREIIVIVSHVSRIVS